MLLLSYATKVDYACVPCNNHCYNRRTLCVIPVPSASTEAPATCTGARVLRHWGSHLAQSLRGGVHRGGERHARQHARQRLAVLLLASARAHVVGDATPVYGQEVEIKDAAGVGAGDGGEAVGMEPREPGSEKEVGGVGWRPTSVDGLRRWRGGGPQFWRTLIPRWPPVSPRWPPATPR